ncbi:MAG: hypothetical protein BZY87_00855 [SAR202 cluster bacterium Io17-Chloro-G6]|nr:MAG: hypothetical protein BZY87_00855 [SAR202 cluster bacterium Io17-Chloro-G6]
MPVQKWYKGNIHTHTNTGGPRIGYPDGDPAADSDPETVTGWYRRHDYDFLVLTDHNHLTLLEYGSSRRRFRKPLMIPGVEVSLRIQNGTKAVHLGAIGINRMVEPIDAAEVVETLQVNVDAIRRAGGIAAINHPNLTWAFNHKHISQVRGASLLEIYNGHPRVHVYGVGGRPGYEEIWDNVLSSGLVIWGVAVDDSHQFKGEFGPNRINPGRGWVVVKATKLDQESIMDGLQSGQFYSSTGVSLESLDSGPDGISLRISTDGDALYTTRFVGRGGVTLKEVFGPEAVFRARGDEGYFRAAVSSSNGARAWTQPVFIN